MLLDAIDAMARDCKQAIFELHGPHGIIKIGENRDMATQETFRPFIFYHLPRASCIIIS